MGWAFSNAGTVTTVFNAVLTPATPATINAGDLLLFATCELFGTAARPAPSTGWTDITPAINWTTGAAVYAKIAVGSDAMPTVSWGNQFAVGQVLVYSGGPSTLTGIVDPVTADRGYNSTNTLLFTGVAAPANDNSLIVAISFKNTLGNASPVLTETGGLIGANRRTTQWPTNNRPTLVIDDIIQGAATTVSLPGMSMNFTEASTQTGHSITFVFTPAAPPVVNTSQGSVPQPGSPALNAPRNMNQFRGVGRISAPAPVIASPLSGFAVSMSVAYGPNVPPASFGFVPSPGPGSAGPFNNNQFLSRIGDTSAPSGSTANIAALAIGTSVGYGPAVAAGNLSGLAVSMSVVYGPGTTIISAGPISGLSVSQSVATGFLSGTALLAGGISISMSVSYAALANVPVFIDNATGGQQLSPDPNVVAPAGYGGQKWGANGGAIIPIGGGASGQAGWDNPIAETISTAQRQANYLVNGKPIAARESDTSLPTTTPDDSLPPGGNNAG